MARRIRVSTWYARVVGPLLKRGTPRADAIGRATRALAGADELPGASDYEARTHPVGRAWVRRVGGRNLWLWYRFNDDEVTLITVTVEPPVPSDEE
ncbi:MAG: hypothetical protein ACLQVI_27710 [Polyangiaceae bacterium]